MISLHQLLNDMIQKGASDLHLTVGSPPMFRINGDLVPVMEEKLTPELTQKLAYSILNENQKKTFEQTNELDLSFGIQNLSRFRANIFMQRGCVTSALRSIPYQVKSIDELGLPAIVKKLCDRPQGLVLVTGPTGSGKSTTLAAMIDKINSERSEHILTIEDPIEFVHRHKKGIINQREVKSDTESFKNALKYALRQDPDIVLIGEMRDLETIETALTIAETGHLTFGTLHTNSAAQTINRVIDMFPATQQTTIRSQLAFVLEAVISQALLPKTSGGRILAAEILVVTPAIRALIRDDKVHQIQGIMEAGQKFGSQTMNAVLAELCRRHLIRKTDAMAYSPEPEQLEKLINKNFNGEIN